MDCLGPGVTLILGGAGSGKSALAERLVSSYGPSALYLATAEAKDPEMDERIARHRERRGTTWQTLEEPLDIAPLLLKESRSDRAILVDCLTLWLSNLTFAERDIETATKELVSCFPKLQGPVCFVSNEVGLGIVPDNALARRFRDDAGRLHQAVAAAAQTVVFVAAGLPLIMKTPER